MRIELDADKLRAQPRADAQAARRRGRHDLLPRRNGLGHRGAPAARRAARGRCLPPPVAARRGARAQDRHAVAAGGGDLLGHDPRAVLHVSRQL